MTRPLTQLRAKIRAAHPELRLQVTITCLLATILFTVSCGTSLYKVKPPALLPALPADSASANLGTISFRAAPLLTDEESHELFESNLLLAGLLPVRVEVVDNGGEAVDFRELHFHLRDAAGTEWKTLSAKQALGRILKANDVY